MKKKRYVFVPVLEVNGERCTTEPTPPIFLEGDAKWKVVGLEVYTGEKGKEILWRRVSREKERFFLDRLQLISEALEETDLNSGGAGAEGARLCGKALRALIKWYERGRKEEK